MKPYLRIALVSAFPPGTQSLNEYGFHLAKGLAERPDVAEVIVLADKLENDAPELELGAKIRVRRVWSFNSLGVTASVLAALKQEKPDGAIYNLQTATFGDREIPAALGLFAPALSRLMGIRSGVVAHNIISGIDLENTLLKGQRLRQTFVRLGGALVTRGLVSANYMTVTLKGYADSLKPRYPKADISLVPHGTFDTTERDIKNVADRPLRIVTMGKFGTYKRLETLLEAFDLLRRFPKFSNAKLIIGGSDHPNTSGYLAQVAEARKDDLGVVFQGYIAEDDIPEFFGNARLSVFDYLATTGSSGVLHQTASYGAVPVFPRIGDFVDLCEDEGLTGAHYEPGNAVDMARAMMEMLLNTRHADFVARANRRTSLGVPFSEIIAFHLDKIAPRRGTKPKLRVIEGSARAA